MHIRYVLTALLALSLAPVVGAQPTTPEEVTAFLQTQMDAEDIPGLQVFVSKGGAVLYHEGLGLADVENDIPMTREEVTILASVSKPFTAAILLTLYDQGRYALDDAINDYLPFDIVHPDFPNTDITFRMLLTHQSGIVDNTSVDEETEGDSPIVLEDYMRDLFVPGGEYYTPDTFGDEPGTEVLYSNDGVALMGYLVEAVSGMAYEAYSQATVFEPLGMDRTSWFLSGVSGQSVAHPHELVNGTFDTLPHPGFPDYPAGQLRTSADQVGRFLQMYHNGGTLDGRQILAPATAQAMLSVQADGTDQGFVWYRATRAGETSWEHNGSIFGITTVVSMLTDPDISVVVLSNGEETRGQDDSMLDGILDGLIEYALQAAVDAEDAPGDRSGYVLEAVAPNPVASRATVGFRTPEAAHVTVEVFDALGRRLAVLADGPVAAGVHQATWDAAGVPSGVYLVRMQADGTVASRSVTVTTR